MFRTKLLLGLPQLSSKRGCGSRPPFVLSREVLQAKSEGSPIVALESTIITHGMPYPHNLQTALQVENIIRKMGATPATIAILKGQLNIGLSKDQLTYLAQAKNVVKASRRDLVPIMAAEFDGATTVAGTIIAAEMADIPVFVTGGIGGVHREGEKTLDISADLNELGRSKTLVVCGGVKSILDIGRTLEYLETQGVCVCSYGQSDDFPSFYTRRSGYKAPHRVPDAQSAARLLQASRQLKLSSGIVIAVPVSVEDAMDETVIENVIQQALKEAEDKGIQGKNLTPYILSAVANATGGSSLETNISLIKNNAKVGAEIAVEYQKLQKSATFKKSTDNKLLSKSQNKSQPFREYHTLSAFQIRGSRMNSSESEEENGDVLVIGGANVDRTYRVMEPNIQLDGSTHVCETMQCGGGVGRNIAEALWRLRGRRAKLLTVIGDDAKGQYLKEIAPGLILEGCVVKGGRTPTYAAVLDAKGECRLGLGDMDLHKNLSAELVDKHIDALKKAPLVVLDGNAPQTTVNYVLKLCSELQKPVFFEPTDRRKALKALTGEHLVTYASPNLAELRAMAKYLRPDTSYSNPNKIQIDEVLRLAKIVCKSASYLLVTLGSKGVLTFQHFDSKLLARLYPAKALNNIINVSGAGDCFSSGFIHGILLGYEEPKCVSLGFKCAQQALFSKYNIPHNLPLLSKLSLTSAEYKDIPV